MLVEGITDWALPGAYPGLAPPGRYFLLAGGVPRRSSAGGGDESLGVWIDMTKGPSGKVQPLKVLET